MAGLITDEDRKFVETWESVSESLHFVINFGPMGEHTYQAINGQRKFTLTTAERLVTQSKIVEEENDPFLNGSFRPIVVPSTVTIETNPNALSDEDIVRIFASSKVAWEEYLRVLDAPPTIRRMIALAETTAGEELPVARYRQLQAKLEELTPRVQIKQRDADLIASTGPSSPASVPGELPKGRRSRAMNPSSSSSSVAGG